MLRAVIGDIIGSDLRRIIIRVKSLICSLIDSCPTDDNIMTLAVAKALLASKGKTGVNSRKMQ